MLSKCHEVFPPQTHVTNYVNDKMLINCRNVDSTKVISSDSDESERDGGVEDEELLLAMEMSMAPTSPKRPPPDVLHE